LIIELPIPDEFSYDRKSRERMMAAILWGLAAVRGTSRRRSRSTGKKNAPLRLKSRRWLLKKSG
jgi:hypothetical protein